MKKTLFLIAAVLFAFTGYSNSKYSIDDTQVETLMEQSTAVQMDLSAESFLSVANVQAEKNVVVALVLDFFLGGFGIHRVYLGTPGGIIAGYFFTCGGIFGIVPLVDFIVLIINNKDISAYVDKKGLFMW